MIMAVVEGCAIILCVQVIIFPTHLQAVCYIYVSELYKLACRVQVEVAAIYSVISAPLAPALSRSPMVGEPDKY